MGTSLNIKHGGKFTLISDLWKLLNVCTAQQEILMEETPQYFLKSGKPITFDHTCNKPEDRR